MMDTFDMHATEMHRFVKRTSAAEHPVCGIMMYVMLCREAVTPRISPPDFSLQQTPPPDFPLLLHCRPQSTSLYA